MTDEQKIQLIKEFREWCGIMDGFPPLILADDFSINKFVKEQSETQKEK